MLGAIAGDIIGSRFEFNNIKTTEFDLFHAGSRFTDDTVLTVAVADSIYHQYDLVDTLKDYYHRYPDAGYGAMFSRWAASPDRAPYNSWGNGAAMRVCPVGFAFDTLEEVLDQAHRTAAVTHNHPEGVKGAQATAAAVFLARTGHTRDHIRSYVANTFQYDLSKSLDSIRHSYQYDVSSQGTVPQALTAFLESTGFEDAIRKAVSLGGDSDTLACITGGIAQAFYGEVPDSILDRVFPLLDSPLRRITTLFTNRYGLR